MPKYDKNKKERIELFLDKEKDAAIIEYLNNNATTRAAFVRHVLHEYVKREKRLEDQVSKRYKKENND